MSYRIREEIFNRIMFFLRKLLYFLLKLDKHKKFQKFIGKDGYLPVMSYNPILKTYRFNCYCFSCPCNSDGLCVTEFYTIPKDMLHEFDSDNIIRNYCG